MEASRRIGLVAHDSLKRNLAEWVEFNYQTLSAWEMVCTGTTGRVVEDALRKMMNEHGVQLPVNLTKLASGPLGGDQQLGALISEGKVDALIFFWDPMMPQPHDVDVKALLRLAVLYNIPTASNRATADFLISSPLFSGGYQRKMTDFSSHLNRVV